VGTTLLQLPRSLETDIAMAIASTPMLSTISPITRPPTTDELASTKKRLTLKSGMCVTMDDCDGKVYALLIRSQATTAILPTVLEPRITGVFA